MSPESFPVLKGDVLLTSKPFAYIVNGSVRTKYCETCLKRKNNLQRCSGCSLLYYCSKDCQKESWITHKTECLALRKLRPNNPPDTARLMVRIIVKLENGGYDVEENVADTRIRKFDSLMNHCSDLKGDPKSQEHFVSLVVVLTSILGKERLPSVDELLKIYGRVVVNCFTITDKDMNGIGTGLFLAGSVLDHSCHPNASVSFNGRTLTVRSLVNWDTLNLDKVRISYIDILNSRENRRKELREGYFFDCNCTLCSNEQRELHSNAVKCGNSECSSAVYIDVSKEVINCSKCSNCGFSDFEPDLVQTYLDIVELCNKEVVKCKSNTPMELYRTLLEMQESILHPLNIHRVRTLDLSFECAIKDALWVDAVSYAKQNLTGLRYHLGSNHPVYGMTLLKLGKVELHLFQFASALSHIESSEPILKMTYGTDHSVIRDDLLPLLKQATQEMALVNMSGYKF